MKKVIIPSAPFKNYSEIEELSLRASGEVRRIQIDVCDGKFVPSVSWPFTEFSKTDFEKMAKKEDLDVYLPAWEKLNYSVDLMVEHPEKYIPTFVQYGVDEVLVHYRSLYPALSSSLENLEKNFNQIVELCKQYELKLILALDTKTDISEVIEFLEKDNNKNLQNIAGFQVMGIEKIGFQGQKFAEDSLDIVRVLKAKFASLPVYFDGSVNEDTVGQIADAGVDVFCVGSYLTKAENFTENLQVLKKRF